MGIALKSISNSIKILKINVFWNRIETEGCKKIIESIKLMKNLTELSLNFKWNRIEENYAKKCIFELKYLLNLRKIKLDFGFDSWKEYKELNNLIN